MKRKRKKKEGLRSNQRTFEEETSKTACDGDLEIEVEAEAEAEAKAKAKAGWLEKKLNPKKSRGRSEDCRYEDNKSLSLISSITYPNRFSILFFLFFLFFFFLFLIIITIIIL